MRRWLESWGAKISVTGRLCTRQETAVSWRVSIPVLKNGRFFSQNN
ncbi:MAG: hypothetical protein IAF02_02345 [Anaerolineae bacterium]|nr:hypothetical protein [Anaerolineae bacterium]